MSFTPAGGFMIGTRSGDLNSGVLLYLMKEKQYDMAQIRHLVNHEAGLKGVSGITADMKTLLKIQDRDVNAALVDYY